MNKRAAMGMFLLAIGAAAACDGADKGGPAGPQVDTTRPATEQCRAISETVCARERTCLMSTSAMPCAFNLDSDGTCARATGATAAVADCHADIRALSCASLFPDEELDLPASCTGAFTFAKSAPEMQCEALADALCKRIVECGEEPVPAAEQPDAIAGCTDAVIESLACFSTTGVSATYPTCLQRLQNDSCAAFDEGIVECERVLQ